MQEHSLFSTPSPAFIVCRHFDDGHSAQCEVIPHCVLICISLIKSDVEYLFMISMSSLEKCLFRSFSHFLIALFVFLALSCISCLYILEIILCQLFHLLLSSPILRVIFLTLLIVFFAVPKLSS